MDRKHSVTSLVLNCLAVAVPPFVPFDRRIHWVFCRGWALCYLPLHYIGLVCVFAIYNKGAFYRGPNNINDATMTCLSIGWRRKGWYPMWGTTKARGL